MRIEHIQISDDDQIVVERAFGAAVARFNYRIYKLLFDI